MTTKRDPFDITPAQHAIMIISRANRFEALAYAQQLKGATLAAVVAAAGCTTYGTITARRMQLVEFLLGAALSSASIRFHDKPAQRAAFLADYRASAIARIEARAHATR